MYTDKVIIALSFLIFCGILGIIIYASVKPDQRIFNVPDEVKPPVKRLLMDNWPWSGSEA